MLWAWEQDIPLDERYDNDTYESWLDYEQHLVDQKKTPEGHRNAYMPDPEEIQQRIRVMRMLEAIGLSDTALDRIMIKDDPPYQLVLQMAERYGMESARKRTHHFLGLKDQHWIRERYKDGEDEPVGEEA